MNYENKLRLSCSKLGNILAVPKQNLVILHIMDCKKVFSGEGGNKNNPEISLSKANTINGAPCSPPTPGKAGSPTKRQEGCGEAMKGDCEQEYMSQLGSFFVSCLLCVFVL